MKRGSCVFVVKPHTASFHRDLMNRTCFKCRAVLWPTPFFIPEKRGRNCVCSSVCAFTSACVCVRFIVMPRTSGLVLCQVVPSQLAVAHAFVLWYALYSAHNTHCCEELFACSPSLVPFCVSFMAVTLM